MKFVIIWNLLILSLAAEELNGVFESFINQRLMNFTEVGMNFAEREELTKVFAEKEDNLKVDREKLVLFEKKYAIADLVPLFAIKLFVINNDAELLLELSEKSWAKSFLLPYELLQATDKYLSLDQRKLLQDYFRKYNHGLIVEQLNEFINNSGEQTRLSSNLFLNLQLENYLRVMKILLDETEVIESSKVLFHGFYLVNQRENINNLEKKLIESFKKTFEKSMCEKIGIN